MNFLKEAIDSEINKKKRELEKVQGGGKKYFRKGDLENIKRQEYLDSEKKDRKDEQTKVEEDIKEKAEEPVEPQPPVQDNKEDEESIIVKISEEELVRRLRSKDQPIRLFAETFRQRVLRLRALELIEERSEGQTNDFRSILDKMDQHDHSHKLGAQPGAKDYLYPGIDSTELSKSMVKTDPDKACNLIYVFFKRALKQWETNLLARPDEEKRSGAGKNFTAIQIQATDYMRPLFRLLKRKLMDREVLGHIADIVMNLQEREYVKANTIYLKLSIGNAPWPIGVTMVGIHERSGREKIHTNQIAHVLNDETQRKWIQSIKRVMTFLEKVLPPDDVSKCVN